MSKGYIITIPAESLYALRITDMDGEVAYYLTPYTTTPILQNSTMFGNYDAAVVHMALLSELQDADPTPDYDGYVADVITVFGETMNAKEREHD